MLLDIALGIFVAHFSAAIWDATVSGWYLIAGISLALLPDIDAVWHYARTREVAMHAGSTKDHRDMLHWPLIYLPLVTIGVYLVAGGQGATLAFMASFLHFLHDSVGTGWGVKWFRPLSQRSFKLFCERDGTPSWRFIVSWTPRELEEVATKYGDPDWIQNLFLRPLWRVITFQAWPPLGLALMLVVEVIFPLGVIGLTAYLRLF